MGLCVGMTLDRRLGDRVRERDVHWITLSHCAKSDVTSAVNYPMQVLHRYIYMDL